MAHYVQVFPIVVIFKTWMSRGGIPDQTFCHMGKCSKFWTLRGKSILLPSEWMVSRPPHFGKHIFVWVPLFKFKAPTFDSLFEWGFYSTWCLTLASTSWYFFILILLDRVFSQELIASDITILFWNNWCVGLFVYIFLLILIYCMPPGLLRPIFGILNLFTFRLVTWRTLIYSSSFYFIFPTT